MRYSVIIIVPVVINLVNTIIEFLQRNVVKLLGYQTQLEEMNAEMSKKCSINFLHTAVIMFLFNLDWFAGFGPFPEGKFGEFTT